MPPNQNTKIKTDITGAEVNFAAVQKTLENVASDFVKSTGFHTEIWAASQDWFLEPWGRDTFIALPGLLLSTGRFEEARQVFRAFSLHEKNGIIPNRIQGKKIMYNTVDASLWFVVALKKYLAITQDQAFVEELWPTVINIIEGYKNGTQFEHFGKTHSISMDTDGLIMSPAQATWMDADPSGEGRDIVTPRNGKAVEINALWYATLCFGGKKYEDLADKMRLSFRKKFWNKTEECLLDVIEGDVHSGALRCNQIIAISHGEDILSKARQKQVLNAVTEDLLTPAGLRTLSPRDSNYHGTYNTQAPMSEKDWAYHQGTVWPWLMGPYIDALSIVRNGQGKYPQVIQEEIKSIIAPLCQFALDSQHKSVPEVFSGDQPHAPGGTTSQAWSVSELLRVIVEYEL